MTDDASKTATPQGSDKIECYVFDWGDQKLILPFDTQIDYLCQMLGTEPLELIITETVMTRDELEALPEWGS